MPEPRKTAVVHTLSKIADDHIATWAEQFLRAKKIERISKNTLAIYTRQVELFLIYCNAQLIERFSQVDPNVIRAFLLWLEETGHNAGGVHMAYRVIRTLFRWYDDEAEPEGWRNPVNKVKAPKLTEEPLEPVDTAVVSAMVKTCDSSFLGKRDKALLLFLLDTGVRARELLAVDLPDVDLITGAVLVRQGKGRKPRDVFMGKETRKAIRAYLKARGDKQPALWILDDATDRLGYGGLRVMLAKRANLAGAEVPTAHDFRRAFAINMLRNGCDLVTLARLMGHKSLKVLQRYLHQITDDLQAAHEKGSPVDRL